VRKIVAVNHWCALFTRISRIETTSKAYKYNMYYKVVRCAPKLGLEVSLALDKQSLRSTIMARFSSCVTLVLHVTSRFRGPAFWKFGTFLVTDQTPHTSRWGVFQDTSSYSAFGYDHLNSQTVLHNWPFSACRHLCPKAWCWGLLALAKGAVDLPWWGRYSRRVGRWARDIRRKLLGGVGLQCSVYGVGKLRLGLLYFRMTFTYSAALTPGQTRPLRFLKIVGKRSPIDVDIT
jgi:hypothetical protein